MDRRDSLVGSGVVCFFRPRDPRGRTLARRMRFFGARATANLRRRPPQFKIHFVPAPFPDDCAHLHEFIRNERREPALFRVPRRTRASGCSVV